MLDDEYEESKVQDMISGAACGVTHGEPGSLVDRNQCEHEPYSGMASGPWQKKLVHMVLGQDDVQGNRSIFGATPEATQHEQILTGSPTPAGVLRSLKGTQYQYYRSDRIKCRDITSNSLFQTHAM